MITTLLANAVSKCIRFQMILNLFWSRRNTAAAAAAETLRATLQQIYWLFWGPLWWLVLTNRASLWTYTCCPSQRRVNIPAPKAHFSLHRLWSLSISYRFRPRIRCGVAEATIQTISSSACSIEAWNNHHRLNQASWSRAGYGSRWTPGVKAAC